VLSEAAMPLLSAAWSAARNPATSVVTALGFNRTEARSASVFIRPSALELS
jgi:hypothetical protein